MSGPGAPHGRGRGRGRRGSQATSSPVQPRLQSAQPGFHLVDPRSQAVMEPRSQTVPPGFQPVHPGSQLVHPPGSQPVPSTSPAVHPGSQLFLGSQAVQPGSQAMHPGSQPVPPTSPAVQPGSQPVFPAVQPGSQVMHPGSQPVPSTSPAVQPASRGVQSCTVQGQFEDVDSNIHLLSESDPSEDEQSLEEEPLTTACCWNQEIDDVVKLHLESLPASASPDIIKYYFENVGENVSVVSVVFEEDNRASVVLSGLTEDELESLLQDKHKIKKKEFIIKLADESCSDAKSCSDADVSSDRVIEVEGSEFGERITEDFLEMYFESKKSGGKKEAIKSIWMTNQGKAIITFHDSEVIANILSKSNHVLCGQALQVKLYKSSERDEYELNKIKVETSGTLDKDFMMIAICSTLNMEKEELSLQMLNEKSFIVTFPLTYSVDALQEMCKKIQDLKMKVTFTAELVKVSGAIVVDNVGYMDEDLIKIYFESAKSGGGDVESVDIISDQKVIVTFKDHRVADCVLQRQHTTIGSKVTVERWTPAVANGKTASDEMSHLKLSSADINPLIIRCLQRDSRLLVEDFNKLNISFECKSDLIVVASLNRGSDGSDDLKSCVVKLILSKFSAETNIPIPAQALPELTETVTNLRDDSLFEFKFGSKSAFIDVAGSKDVMSQFRVVLKTLLQKFTQTKAIVKLTPSEHEFVVQLMLQELKKKFPSVLITTEGTSGLKLVGSVADVENVDKSFSKLRRHECIYVELPASVVNYLHNAGKLELNHYVQKESTRVGVFYSCENNQKRVHLLCRCSEVHFAEHVLNIMKKELLEVRLDFPKSFLCVKNELTDFKDICESMESAKKVKIIICENFVLAAGFREDVEYCRAELGKYIQEKSKVKKSIKIEHGMWKLFNSYMKEQWKEVASGCEGSAIDITYDSSQRPVVLYGDRIKVEEILAVMDQLKSSVFKKVLPVQRPGTYTFFKSEKGRLYLDGIERRVQVAICISTDVLEDEDQEKDSDDVLGVGKCTTKCTAFVNQIKVEVCVGSITEYEADVIVNAANEQLNHYGGVAAAIATKGGAIIQEDSTQHVRKIGQVDTGDAWLTTQTGNLPCKALIHAVGPTWKGGRCKEEALLYKVSKICLMKASEYRSIVFPAISSGIYGFPIQLCANTMVRAVSDYAKSSGSSLQRITFILLPMKDVDTHVMAFISGLKQNLPPETVHVKNEGRSKVAIRHTPVSVNGGESVSVKKVVFDKLEIRQGGLLDVKADVYVNTTNSHLDLSQGAVSLALLKAGGKSLQLECSKAAPINVGEVATTGSGALPCRYLFHTVLPSYRKHSTEGEKVMRKSVRKCLKLCDQKGCKSIAFPSLGTGNLGYPNDIVAKIMIEEVFKCLAEHKSSISHVHFMVYMKETFQEFKKIISSYRPQDASVEKKSNKKRKSLQSLHQNPTVSKELFTPSKESFNIKKLTVTISRGDITESTCDVIVNPTDSKLTLTGQGVAGAILAKGGRELKQACDALSSNGKVLDDRTLVIKTRAPGRLKCKCLFHICFDGNDSKSFQRIITECLEKAEREKNQSIAFPAIGTGVHNYPDEKAATGMLNVLYQFSSSDVRYLKHVDIVLFQEATYTNFVQAFRNPSIEEGFLQKAKNLLMKPFTYSTDSEITPVSEPVEPDKLDVLIYGDAMDTVKEAERLFFNLLDEIFITDFIDNPLVNELSSEEETQLEKICQSNKVHIVIDRNPMNRIVLKGDKSQVHEMKCKIVEKISEIEQRASVEREAKQLSERIQWKRLNSDENYEDYDVDVNYEIEGAYQKNSTGRYTHGNYSSEIHFSIDFKKFEETDHTLSQKYPVIREDIFDMLKKGAVPKYWDDMPADMSFHIVDVNPQSKEYADVLAHFEKTMIKNQSIHPSRSLHRPPRQPIMAAITGGSQYYSIVKIQRIQNLVLYGQYQAKKKEMDKTNKSGTGNEKWLFHGTSADTCTKINQQGFNRSFSGRNAVVYGNGVYFAEDASYSARNTYSPPDANGYKYMYFARVLTGEYALGSQGLLVPPPKDPTNPAILYDSVVDNPQNPKIFVTFHDASNYPEYLIVFN